MSDWAERWRGTAGFSRRLLAVAVFQTAILGWIITERLVLLTTGREIVLDVVPVDPRSLFRGDYVVLSYGISRLDAALLAQPVEVGEPIYVTLRRTSDGAWAPTAAGRRPPATTGDEEIVLRGRVESRSSSGPEGPATLGIAYGIESYFVPEGTGRELEQQIGDKRISAVIAVDGSGQAAIKGVEVDGTLIHREQFF